LVRAPKRPMPRRPSRIVFEPLRQLERGKKIHLKTGLFSGSRILARGNFSLGRIAEFGSDANLKLQRCPLAVHEPDNSSSQRGHERSATGP
jgi:hypothetical protein